MEYILQQFLQNGLVELRHQRSLFSENGREEQAEGHTSVVDQDEPPIRNEMEEVD